MNHQEIKQLIDDKFGTVIEHIKAQDPTEFSKVYKPEKWSNGQHLDHLRKTTRAFNKGLTLPKLALRLKFGKHRGEQRTYEQIISDYKRLVKTIKAPASVVPDPLTNEDKARVLDWFAQEQTALKKGLTRFTEKQLSSYQLPHPVLGKLSIRELSYWCVMHTEHHYELMKRDNCV